MLDSTILLGVGEETSGNICHSDAFNNDEMCNRMLSELSADQFLELNDLSCLGESCASDVVSPDYSSFQYPMDFYPGSQIITASGVGDFLHAGRETALKQTEQDIEVPMTCFCLHLLSHLFHLLFPVGLKYVSD